MDYVKKGLVDGVAVVAAAVQDRNGFHSFSSDGRRSDGSAKGFEASKMAGLASESADAFGDKRKGFVVAVIEMSSAWSASCVLASATWAKGFDISSVAIWHGMVFDSEQRNGLDDDSEMDVVCGNGADVDPMNGLVAAGVLSSSTRSPKNAESQRATPPGASPTTTHIQFSHI